MGTVQNIKTPSGDNMVVLSQDEYDALLDRLSLAEARADYNAIKAGEQEAFPSTVADALLDGDHSPIKVFREYRGLSASAVAARAGISQAYFSEIESGKKSGGVRALQKIAEALSVDLNLIVPVTPEPDVELGPDEIGEIERMDDGQ